MNKELIKALEEMERSKGISKATILEALRKALEKSYEKNFADHTNVEVSINEETGDIKIYALKDVVETVENPLSEISLAEAQTKRKRIEIGDTLPIEVKPKNFGRVAAQTAKNIIIQKMRDAEREAVYDTYIQRLREMITGTVQRVDRNNVFIQLGKTEGILPANERIPGEVLEPGDRVKLYVSEVRNTTRGPQVVLSRANPTLATRLFEQEVPEIATGVVEIFSVAREAGSRTKIAVFSTDATVDPIGACVGYKGSRVNHIVDELNGEKMDIIVYDADSKKFIANALSPSEVERVFTNVPERSATVIVPDDQLSLAIGKEGQNVRLAARLTQWKIDIKSHSQYMEDPASFEALEISEAAPKEQEESSEEETAEERGNAALRAAESLLASGQFSNPPETDDEPSFEELLAQSETMAQADSSEGEV